MLSESKVQNQRHKVHQKEDAERGWTLEDPINVFDRSDNGKWIREEAVVDSGAAECVTSKKRIPHLRGEETPESRRGEA